jgi:glycosyltransferase involved in cell wall biosynthesis
MAINLPRMRSVLHVLPHPGGGGETYVDSLARMDDYRLERLFLARSREPVRALPVLGVNAARANLAARRHDVVHTHGEVASFFCLPALARQPSVITLHGLNLARRLNAPAARIAAINLRLLVRAATRTVCVSHAERDEVLHVVGSADSASVVVVPNGVELARLPTPEERATARADLRIRNGEVVVVAVGALDTPKDPVTPARAAIATAGKGIPLVLIFAGEGNLRTQLEEAVRGAERTVRVLGHRTDTGRVLAAADVFALSSQREGLPYALLEAMAMGLPAIVSDYAGATDVVGDAGIVVRRGDVDAFAHALERFATDAPERLLLGERARARIARDFSLDEMISRTREIYDAVLEERGRH